MFSYDSGTLGPTLSCNAVYVESRYLSLLEHVVRALVCVARLDRRGMQGRMTMFFFKGYKFMQSTASKPTFTTWDLGTRKSLYIYIYTHTYVSIYVYIRIYLSVYVYIYIYIKMLNYIACSRDPNICTCRQTQDKLLESGNPNAGVRGKAMQWSAWLCRTCGVQPMLDAQHEWWVTCCYVCSHIKAELSSDVERFSHNRWYISMTRWCM